MLLAGTMNKPLLGLALAFAAAWPTAARAGWTATQTSKSIADKGTPVPQTAKLSCDKSQFRVDQADDSSVIIDLESAKVTILNHSKKQWGAMTLDELKALRDKQIGQMKAALPNLPPEVKKKVEEQLAVLEGKAKKADPGIKATGKKDKVGGLDCAIYTWTAQEGPGEACVATKVPAEVTAFTKSFTQLSEKLGSISGGAGMSAIATLGKYGFPVRTRHALTNGEVTVEVITETTDIKEAKIDPARFVPPADYAKTDLLSMTGPKKP